MTTAFYRRIEGTSDFHGPEAVRYDRIMAHAAEFFGRYGYRHVQTPVFETTELFARSIGDATDIVEKEMYTFQPGSESVTLRPEGTAAVVRAFLQNHWAATGGGQKFWYAGPFFRRERPQKGRLRQFHQLGAEAMGSGDPLLDAETVYMGLTLLSELGITRTLTRLNTIGCLAPGCRPQYRERLRQALSLDMEKYCPVCQKRFHRNLLRILDCKNPKCRELASHLPKSHECLCGACEAHFAVVREALTALGVDARLDATLVRGLDYYARTVFEFTHEALGAQDALGGGGRYDGLVKEIGGPDTPAIGLALGIERMMLALETVDGCACEPPLQIFGISLGDGPRRAMVGMLARLRQAGLSADMDYEGRSFKAQMRVANKRGALFCLILGEDELGRGEIVLKDMREGAEGQISLPLGDLMGALLGALRAAPAGAAKLSCPAAEGARP